MLSTGTRVTKRDMNTNIKYEVLSHPLDHRGRIYLLSSWLKNCTAPQIYPTFSLLNLAFYIVYRWLNENKTLRELCSYLYLYSCHHYFNDDFRPTFLFFVTSCKTLIRMIIDHNLLSVDSVITQIFSNWIWNLSNITLQ